MSEGRGRRAYSRPTVDAMHHMLRWAQSNLERAQAALDNARAKAIYTQSTDIEVAEAEKQRASAEARITRWRSYRDALREVLAGQPELFEEGTDEQAQAKPQATEQGGPEREDAGVEATAEGGGSGAAASAGEPAASDAGAGIEDGAVGARLPQDGGDEGAPWPEDWGM